ncbi:MAG TPA: hypothetical protein VGC67_17030 [Cellulomonas sp.]
MTWIRTIGPEDATGELAESYAWQAHRLGAPTDFTLLGSLEPPLVHARLVLYRATENATSALTVTQRTLVGHVVSALNRTPHCTSRSRIKLLELGLPAAVITQVEAGDDSALAPADAALVAYARKLTLTPGDLVETDLTELRRHGFGDHEIVDANAQIAHLNYTNRVANGLGLRDEVAPDFPAFATVPR